MEELKVEKKNGVYILEFSGELTLDIVDGLKEETEKHFTSDDCRVLVMDLSRTVFLDSSGIGYLVQINNRKKSYDKEFYLFQPSPQVRKTLSLVKLIDYFNILDTQEDLKALTGE